MNIEELAGVDPDAIDEAADVVEEIDTGADDDLDDAGPATVEDYARARGWKPKEEWTGEGEHRSAQEFLDFGLDRAKDVARDLKDLRKTTETMAETQARIMREQVERAREEERQRLMEQHDRAVEEGDTEAARQIVGRIAETRNDANTPDASVQSWVAENPWFNADPAAQAVAKAKAAQLAQGGASTAEQLKAAREEVFKRFPEHAPAEERTPAKAVEVAKPAALAKAPKRGKTFADLPREAQEAARQMVKQGLLKNTDGYVRQYFNKEGTVE